MRRVIALGLVIAGAALSGGAHAQSGVRLQLGGDEARPGLASTSEHGVRVWRGAAPASYELLGVEPAAASCDCDKTVVIVRVSRNPARRLRTQGFYSGLGRKGWAYTQGFYSGQKTYR